MKKFLQYVRIQQIMIALLMVVLVLGLSYSSAQEGEAGMAPVAPNMAQAGLEPQAIRISELEPLPTESKYDQIITFNTGLGGASLPVMIEALAHSAGLTAVIEDVPDKLVTYNLGKKPFRQIWQILISLNGLDYELLPNDVIIVGTVETISRFNEREPQPLQEVVEMPPVIEEPEPVLEQRFYRVSGDTTELAAALATVAPEASVAPFPTIQTISVRATALEHNAVATALKEIDIVEEPEVVEAVEPVVEVEPEVVVEEEPEPEVVIEYADTEQRVYRLSNAVAEDIAAILQQSTEAQTPEVDTQAQAEVGIAVPPGASLETLEDGTKLITPEVGVVADQRTNSLIIQATAEQHLAFGSLIPQLDIAQKQVNVQVRIQEIKKSTVNSLGVDLSGGFGNFSATILDTGLNFVFDAQRAISGLNIGAVLDTYETQGLSRRVDDTNLTVLDNGEGTMQSGGVITVVDRTGSTGEEVNSLEIPYGVQITVKPRIGNDGRITMTVQAKVEDLLSPLDSTDIQRSSNSVESLISLEPGQTVLLGGLFQNKFKENIQGTPILSSIPIIGAAFSNTTVEEDESELLLIVTANIID